MLKNYNKAIQLAPYLKQCKVMQSMHLLPFEVMIIWLPCGNCEKDCDKETMLSFNEDEVTKRILMFYTIDSFPN